MKLASDWKEILKRAWSVRLSLLMSIPIGLLLIWPQLAYILPLWVGITGAIGMSLLVIIARITHQEGIT